MGRSYDSIDDRMAEWVQSQPVFFVGTAPLAEDGHVNVSPKGNRGELAVLDERRVAYLEQTGSGVETIAHLRENGRIVMMWCAFDGPARIIRFHGRARAVVPGEDGWDGLASAFRSRGGDPDGIGVRSAIVMDVERVADSCGYGVPLMNFRAHRPAMDNWARGKGPDGIAAYQSKNNARSIDGLAGLAD
ncbi:pyridoxamine 5'-phosphate oxidase family protein [Acidiferrimicrobium sp. IK]|uniref:pyridoxamine 5'-phosphate oxidase family protein n=1 Tax=Acidiferrimicrobium sp. IK TaxID=2871700 RepID=UPI0021CB90CA|nr:pyridoxamine 5'-phosphate oxidase family protein [Acidiferrimicrobium sp. IK]MCU4183242.1 pyridoxamine 5'-phosphate oxidase family protein [Acidiferrimicrobium sp. IK]